MSNKNINWKGVMISLLYVIITILMILLLYLLRMLMDVVFWGAGSDPMLRPVLIIFLSIPLFTGVGAIGGFICSIGEISALKEKLRKIFFWLPVVYSFVFLIVSFIGDTIL